MNKYNVKFVMSNDDSVEVYFFSKLTSTSVSYWTELRNNINQLIDKISSNYIWHKDKFEICAPIWSELIVDSKDLPEHLHCCTHFGDNIEDEWYIVYLILEITKTYKELIVQVKDSDGELLLIEAADVLPKWVNPDNTENRVFIHQGNIHIIPPKIIDLTKNIEIKDAVKTIAQFPNETLSSKEVHEVIAKRIGNYPEKQFINIHRAVVAKIPRNIAAILKMKPSIISAIVDAYCNCDRIDLKLCKNVELNDTVNITVTFTKCLYAMLIHTNTDNFKHVDLGSKLTYGYHILMNRSLEGAFSSKEWIAYFKQLNNTGYFKENLEGSKEYVQLLETAKKYFISTECSTSVKVANEIKEIMGSDEYHRQYEWLKQNEPLLIDDSDDWLTIQPIQLEELLKSRYGEQAKFNETEVTPQTISNKLSSFLKESSDFEGIENNPEDRIVINDDNDTISLDPNLFSETLSYILNLVDPGGDHTDNESSESEPEGVEYKKSPLDTELENSLLDSRNNEVSIPENTLVNLTQSVKEEGGSSGPSSNLLRNICIYKSDLIVDSDDCEE